MGFCDFYGLRLITFSPIAFSAWGNGFKKIQLTTVVR